MLRLQLGKNLIEAQPAAIGGNAEGKTGVCAIIAALSVVLTVLSRQTDVFMWNFHHA